MMCPSEPTLTVNPSMSAGLSHTATVCWTSAALVPVAGLKTSALTLKNLVRPGSIQTSCLGKPGRDVESVKAVFQKEQLSDV